MAVIRRLMTEEEHGLITRALPLKLRPIMAEIDFVKCNCWNCLHRTWETHHCNQFDIPIPHDQLGANQLCFEQLVIPF